MRRIQAACRKAHAIQESSSFLPVLQFLQSVLLNQASGVYPAVLIEDRGQEQQVGEARLTRVSHSCRPRG
jgi:hypothetical protein